MREYHPGWSERVLTFQRTGQGHRALLDELATYTYHYPRRKLPTLDEDAAGDFYLFCHDKLEQVIVRFRDCGKPFERYLNSVLSWQLRSFLAKRRHADHAWRTSLRSQLWDDPERVAEETPAPAAAARPQRRDTNLKPVREAPGTPLLGGAASGTPSAATSSALASPVARRRLLYGVLKTGHRLDERQLAAAAQATGYELPRLRSMIEQLRRGRVATQRRLELLRGRRNRAFAQLQLWSAAAHQDADRERRAQAAARAARYRHAVEAAQAELARVRVAPSNREIAALLLVPKGTVDTGLYWLRRQTATDYAASDAVGAGEQQSA